MEDQYCPVCGGKLREGNSLELPFWCPECQEGVERDDALSKDERDSLRALWEDEEETV